ncbi:MAG: GGDEF domain-containing protein [Spirochaetia bacterium]|nr:GGDEF domain-containing protein [Spirochaetia bacterium]
MITENSMDNKGFSEINSGLDMKKFKQELTALCSVMKNGDNNKTLIEILQDVGKMAFSDELSGLPNRFYFKYFLSKCVSKARCNNESLAVVMLDIDNFKRINDVYGHTGGDCVIEQFSKILGGKVRSVQSLVQEKNLYSRYGGDEFALVLPNATEQGAARLADRIKTSIQNYLFTTPLGTIDQKITASFGVALFNAEMETYENLLQHADEAMYLAKRKGKNCVVVKGE